MPANIKTENYENMISALMQFASRISDSAYGIQAVCGESLDIQCQETVDDIMASTSAIITYAEQAENLAKDMWYELNEIRNVIIE